jgi:hypothetical protein
MLKRWNQHVSKSRSSKGGRWHFPNAIRKYGPEAFSHEILEVCTDLEVANLAEKCWIELYDTRNPEKGFNLTKGGAHAPHLIRKNPWDDPAYRKRCTEAARATFNDPEVRSKIRQAQSALEYCERKAAINREISSRPEVRARMATAFSGKSHTPETCERIRSAHRGRKLGPEHVAKMSESIRRSPRMKAARALRSMEAREKTRTMTHQKCSVHGLVPISETYRSMNGGVVRFQCKVCVRLRIARIKHLRSSSSPSA